MATDSPTVIHQPARPREGLSALILCAAILMAAALLRLSDAGEVVVPHLEAYPLPATCPSRVLLHMDCPGCGLTRSFIAMAHGQLARAFAFHRLGPALFALLVLQTAVSAWSVARDQPPPALARGRVGTLASWAILVALFANWGYNLLTGAAFHGR